MHILQVIHGKPEFEYNNREYFKKRGDRIASLNLSMGESAPEPREHDAIIVYGGYMSAYDDTGHPWISTELHFLEACLKTGTPILGICLGSQLLARLLGARVFKTQAPEFGFKKITLTEQGVTDPVLGRLSKTADRSFIALEWHGDAWDLPKGAVRLAQSAAWENQAFRYGPKVLAMQFHLEFTREHMAFATKEEIANLPSDPNGENPEVFAAPGPKWEDIRRSMATLLDGFLDV